MERKPWELNLFMVCEKVNKKAFGELPIGYKFVKCNEESLDDWIRLCAGKPEHIEFVKDCFNRIYASRKEEFFDCCIFVENDKQEKIATCFIWNAYKKFNAVHWFVVSSECEGKGIGRAILTKLLSELKEKDFPVYLSTHPHLSRAIGLYIDFGFSLITNSMIGKRVNDYLEGEVYLKEGLLPKYYNQLQRTTTKDSFIELMNNIEGEEF